MHLSLGLAKTVFALAATFDDLLDLSFVLIFFFPRLIFVYNSLQPPHINSKEKLS